MRRLLLLLVFIAFVIANESPRFPREVTIDAAFRYEGDLFLISGDEYMAVAPDGVERYLRVRSGSTEVPANMTIQAAIHWPHQPTVDYFGSETAFSTNQTSQTSDIRRYRNHDEFLFLQNGGPDAAAFKGPYNYIFRGCHYVKQTGAFSYLGQLQNIADIDESLPCDIDAAWTSNDRVAMTILKGDQIWIWVGNKVYGPSPFESKFIIWSWQLKPNPDNRFQL